MREKRALPGRLRSRAEGLRKLESTEMPRQPRSKPSADRPKRSGKSLKVYLQPQEYQRLKDYTVSTDRTLAVVVRRAVAAYLNRQENPEGDGVARPEHGQL
jgi:hypothetical protein